LLGKLGGLPLALAQAGAYIGATGLTAEEYIAYYDETWDRLMAYQDLYPLQEYAERSVLTTWKMSYEHVRAVNVEAAALLDQWAFLDPGDISDELIETYNDKGETRVEHESLPRDKLSFRHAAGVLSQYSLVNNTEGTGSFSIHAVVHEWSLYNIADDQGRERLCVRAIRMVAESTPKTQDASNFQAARRLLPHARMAATRYSKMEEVSGLELELHRIAFFMQKWESSQEVELLFLGALRGFEEAWGAKHTSTLDTVGNLGNLYNKQGKMKEAEEMYVRALGGYEEAWGAKHTSTLSTVGNLGSLYADQGKMKEAEEMYLRALRGKEEAWGAKHTSTLDIVNNLGLLYADQGKLKEAEEMYLRALRGYEEALGAKHTSTLDTVNNLGLLYADQGKLTEAEEMYLRALRGYEEAWGSKHTSTQDTIYELGNLYHDRGDVAKAKAMYERAAEGYTDVEVDRESHIAYIRKQLFLLGGTDSEAGRSSQAVGR
jgi:tetratricopeptide (TPR) repeat protein